MANAAPVVDDRLDGRVAARSAGADDAPVAIFLHGLGGSRHDWDAQLRGLADLRHTLACDLPGYGDSPGLPESLPQLAGVIAAWIADLGATQVDLVGLSFGGMLAQHVALEHPEVVRTLALLDTSPAFGLDGVTTPESWLASRVAPLRDDERAARAETVVAGLVGPHASQQIRDQAIASMRAVPETTLAASCRALVAHDTREQLARIAVPTIVMVGAEDTETPPSYAQAIAERIPGAELTVVPDAGHLLNLEAPEVVNEALRRLWTTGDQA